MVDVDGQGIEDAIRAAWSGRVPDLTGLPDAVTLELGRLAACELPAKPRHADAARAAWRTHQETSGA